MPMHIPALQKIWKALGIRKADDWQESKHPRASNGQFGSGGGKPKPKEPPDLFHGDQGERPIRKAKDDSGHEHGSDGKFTGAGSGGSGKSKSPKREKPKKESQRQHLSNNEKKTIDNYKRTGYAKVNAHLRRGDKAHMSPADRETATASIEQLDAILGKSSLKREMRVFRGVGDPEIFKNFDRLNGATISDAGFLSTSQSVDIAAQHARSANMGIKQKGKPVKGIIAVMKLPKGTKAISLGDDDSEKEVICHRGSSFRVVGTDKSGPYWRIDLEAVA